MAIYTLGQVVEDIILAKMVLNQMLQLYTVFSEPIEF